MRILFRLTCLLLLNHSLLYSMRESEAVSTRNNEGSCDFKKMLENAITGQFTSCRSIVFTVLEQEVALNSAFIKFNIVNCPTLDEKEESPQKLIIDVTQLFESVIAAKFKSQQELKEAKVKSFQSLEGYLKTLKNKIRTAQTESLLAGCCIGLAAGALFSYYLNK